MQVAEVLSQSKCRHSVSGWFHGPSVPRPIVSAEPKAVQVEPCDIDEEEFFSLLNGQYMDPLTQSEIQDKFEEESEIQLSDFLPVSVHDHRGNSIAIATAAVVYVCLWFRMRCMKR